MMNIGLENIEAHEKTIAAELLKLGDVDGIRILGPRENVDPHRHRGVRRGPACIRTMWASSSTPRASRFAWDTTAPSRYTATSAYTHPTVPPPVSTIRSKMPKRWSKRPRASVSSLEWSKTEHHERFGMSGDDLEQMYQEVILEASKHPHGKESFAPNAAVEQSADAAANVTVQASHEYCTPGESHQFNPTCGDEATIHVEVSDDEPHTIKRLVWDGHGCSISQASLSVMVDLVDGKTVDEAMDLEQTFHKLMESRGAVWTTRTWKKSSATPWYSKACRNTLCASNALC